MMIGERENMESLSDVSSISSRHCFAGEILINSDLFKDLSPETRNHLRFEGSHFLEKFIEMIEMEWAKEHLEGERQYNVRCLSDLFDAAGFTPIHVKVIDNQYSSAAWCYPRPWLEVTTPKGMIKIGWRKRVISLDWSASDIEAKAEDLFPNEDVTKYDKLIHAWSYEKAIEYLKKLKDA